MSGTNQLSIIIFIGIVNKIKNIQVKKCTRTLCIYISKTHFILTYDVRCE